MSKKENLVLAILMPVSICILFAIVVVLAFQWSDSHSATAPNSQQPAYQNNPASNNAANPTPANTGTTYTNATYGFQINYLNAANQPSQVYSTSPVVLGASGLSIQQLHEVSGAFSDSTMTNKNAICLIPAGSSENSVFFSYQDSETLGGTTAYHYANYPNPNARFCDNPAGCFYYDIYRISHNGNCYEIIYERQGSTAMPSDISQMISSFAFNQ